MRWNTFFSAVAALAAMACLAAVLWQRSADGRPTSRPASASLVEEMSQRGVTARNTARIVLTDSEGGTGATAVEIDEEFIIQKVWDSIHQSRPHDRWAMSGFQRADFYTGPGDTPAATLWVNETDACFLDGQSASKFRCPELHALASRLLQEAHEKRRGARKAK